MALDANRYVVINLKSVIRKRRKLNEISIPHSIEYVSFDANSNDNYSCEHFATKFHNSLAKFHIPNSECTIVYTTVLLQYDTCI